VWRLKWSIFFTQIDTYRLHIKESRHLKCEFLRSVVPCGAMKKQYNRTHEYRNISVETKAVIKFIADNTAKVNGDVIYADV
jgi:hypothetical protein